MALFDKSELLIKIGADVKGAVGGINSVQGKLTDLGSTARAASSGDIGGLVASFKSAAAAGGPVTIAVTAVTAVVAAYGAALVAATAAAFDFARQAAEYGAKINDASVQTGLGAEALSALNVIAEQQNVEFSKLVTSINKFSILVGEAGEGSKSAAEKLSKFGITAKEATADLEGALTKVVKKINDLPPGVERANAAAAAFGARGGKDMIKIVDQMNGDLPGVIQKMKDLGLTIDAGAARAADDFGDKLKIITMRFDMVKTKIGLEVMPAFSRFFDFMDTKLKESGASVEDWAKRIGNVFMGLELIIERVIDFFVSNRFGAAIAKVIQFTNPLLMTLTVLEKLGMTVNRTLGGALGGAPTSGGGEPDPAGGGGGGGDGGAKAKADKARQEQLESVRLMFARLRQQVTKEIDAWNAQFGPVFEDGILMYPQAEDIEADMSSALISLNEGYRSLITTLNAQRDIELGNKELTEQARNNITERYAQEELKLEEEKQAKLAQLRTKANDAVVNAKEREMQKRLQQQDEEDAEEIRRVEKSVGWEFIKLNKIREIKIERLELEKKFLAALAAAEKEDLAAHERYLARIEEISRRIKELKQEQEDSVPAGEPADEKPKSRGFFDGFGDALGDSSMVDEANGKLEAMQGLGNLLGETFKQVAQGLGNLVQQWVLTGEVGPKAMRKLTASILAGLAAQAAVEALMELARGFKELALGNPASAALHFKAAAIFGAVAGVAAVAGRAIAGDAFKSESDRSAGRDGRSSGPSRDGQGQGYSSQEGATINASQGGVSLAPTAEIVIRDASGMFSQLFEAEIRNNSRVRRLIIDTANT